MISFHLRRRGRPSPYARWLFVSDAPRQDDLSVLPMRFALHQVGAGGGLRIELPACSSRGERHDHRRDAARLRQCRARPGPARRHHRGLDSKGGSVLGAIALGRAIRWARPRPPTVGRVREQAVTRRRPSKRPWVRPRGECQSMCPFVLLGGVKRYVPQEARVLVHQDLGSAIAATMPPPPAILAEDLALVQRDIGKPACSTRPIMGGGAELLEVRAAASRPWEPDAARCRATSSGAPKLDTGQDRLAQDRAGWSPPSRPVRASMRRWRSRWRSSMTAAAVDAGAARLGPMRGSRRRRRAGAPASADHRGRAHRLVRGFARLRPCAAGTYACDHLCGDAAQPGGPRLGAPLKKVDLWIEGKTTLLDVVSSHSSPSVAARAGDARERHPVGRAWVKSFAGLGDRFDARSGPSARSLPGTHDPRIGNKGLLRAFSSSLLPYGEAQSRLH